MGFNSGFKGLTDLSINRPVRAQSSAWTRGWSTEEL